MTYEELVDELPILVPAAADEYERVMASWRPDRPGPHVVYGDVLNPMIESYLERADEEALRTIFNAIEQLATSVDERVRNVVSVTICEYLGRDLSMLRKAREYMGPATRRLSDWIEGQYGSSETSQ